MIAAMVFPQDYNTYSGTVLASSVMYLVNNVAEHNDRAVMRGQLERRDSNAFLAKIEKLAWKRGWQIFKDAWPKVSGNYAPDLHAGIQHLVGEVVPQLLKEEPGAILGFQQNKFTVPNRPCAQTMYLSAMTRSSGGGSDDDDNGGGGMLSRTKRTERLRKASQEAVVGASNHPVDTHSPAGDTTSKRDSFPCFPYSHSGLHANRRLPHPKTKQEGMGRRG